MSTVKMHTGWLVLSWAFLIWTGMNIEQRDWWWAIASMTLAMFGAAMAIADESS